MANCVDLANSVDRVFIVVYPCDTSMGFGLILIQIDWLKSELLADRGLQSVHLGSVVHGANKQFFYGRD